MTAPSGPAMSTTSPAAKSPLAPVTPTARRLRPWSLRTGTAQALTVIVPDGLWKYASQRFPRLEREAAWNEESPGTRAREKPRDDPRLGPVGDEDAASGLGREPGGRDLAHHAPDRRLACRPAGHGLDLRSDPLDDGHDPAGPLQVDQPRGRREDQQELRPHQARDHRREGVVVAEADPGDLGCAYRVVLVDDRDGPVADHLRERLLDPEVARPRAQVLVGQEHLGDRDPVGREPGLPGLHQETLADGGARLLLRACLDGRLREAEPAHPEADGTRGDDDHLGAGRPERGKLGADVGDPSPCQGGRRRTSGRPCPASR